MNIGVLALQGAFIKHQDILFNLGINCSLIKYSSDLKNCDGLIIPGGESTTMTKLILNNNLYETINNFGLKKPVFGTCAGLILMSKYVDDYRVLSFNYLDIQIERNGWGSQKESFEKNIYINFNKNKIKFKATFIRAPKIIKYNKDIKILSKLNNMPILIKYDKYLGSIFHPELVNDSRIHQYFIEMINGNK